MENLSVLILAYIKGRAATPNQIAKSIGKNSNEVAIEMAKLIDSGEIKIQSEGKTSTTNVYEFIPEDQRSAQKEIKTPEAEIIGSETDVTPETQDATEAAEMYKDELKDDILEALYEDNTPLTITEIAEKVDESPEMIEQAIGELVDEGQIEFTEATYQLPKSDEESQDAEAEEKGTDSEITFTEAYKETIAALGDMQKGVDHLIKIKLSKGESVTRLNNIKKELFGVSKNMAVYANE